MSGKYYLSLFVGLNWLAAGSAFAAAQPAGKLIELHSCEVYTGGCTCSSEEPQGGRQMLQIWDLASGSWQGVDLSGLKVGVLETSSENLAKHGARPESAVVYLPTGATSRQHQALIAWLKSRDGKLAASEIQTRVVPISIESTTEGVNAALGQIAAIRTVSLVNCLNGTCGEDLFYQPTVSTSAFTVALDKDSTINEPKLELKWNDHDKRNIFIARFGDTGNAKNLFVESSDWCGPTGKLF
jgi:hypothetical protein